MIYLAVFTFLLLGILGLLIYKAKNVPTPKIDDSVIQNLQLSVTKNATRCGDSIRLNNNFGFYEVYTEGKAFERAYSMGKVLEDLKYEHEKNFIASIRTIVSSEIRLNLLKFFIGILNRNLHKYFKTEYREELYGLSLSSNPSFNSIAPPYQRILNYHAAHDIGHTLQNYGLVGCSSFVIRNTRASDGELLMARNLDFSPSEDFNKLKVLYFIAPQNAYRYISYSWPGFIGVISGMNEHGICVVLHSSKTQFQLSVGTPVSIIAREILQEAKTIEEAGLILKKRKSFVAELFLVSSGKEKHAVVFEKQGHALSEYQMQGEQLVCTNHLLSKEKKNSKENLAWQNTISSAYREKRLIELLGNYSQISPEDAATILRDVRGLNEENIGLQNENAINQLAAHHGVIFKPESLKIWVSANPYNMGEFLEYDFEKSFAQFKHLEPDDTTVSSSFIAKDSFLESDEYHLFLSYKKAKKEIMQAVKSHTKLTEDYLRVFKNSNPLLFTTYEILGDYYLSQKEHMQAKESYEKALDLNIPTLFDKQRIEKKWNKI